jgi:hypothetical protein
MGPRVKPSPDGFLTHGGVYGPTSKEITSRRQYETVKRFKMMSSRGRNAKSLCDSGISTPSGDANFSSLYSVAGCRGGGGHEIGFDFTKSDIILGHQLQEQLEDEMKREEGPLYQGAPTFCVGMVTFNQAYTNSPASVVRCTSCNRVDFNDRASNMGLSSAYEMPSEAFVREEQRAIKARDKEAYWAGTTTTEEEDGERSDQASRSASTFLPRLETASPVTSRYYVAKSRDRGAKEMDTAEVGDAMSKNGCCFGLTYLGAEKLDPLTFVLQEPADPTKTRMVRYSVAKLLRRKLPNLLNERYGKSTTETSTTRVYVWERQLHPYVFCSFETTRMLFDHLVTTSGPSSEAQRYLLERVEEQLLRMYHGTLVYMQQEGVVSDDGNEDYRKPFCEEYCTESYVYESMDNYTRDELLEYCENNILGGEERPSAGFGPYAQPRLSRWRTRRGDISQDQNMWTETDACESFDVFQGPLHSGESYEVDPDEWRGPWYRHTQSMDEDELAFFNLNPACLVPLHMWLMTYEEYGGNELTVLAAMLLRLYVSNDVMHALSATRDRMLRLLLQLFVDQMLDLYTFCVSFGTGTTGPTGTAIRGIPSDPTLLLSRSERDELFRVERGEDMPEEHDGKQGPRWWLQRKRAFREGWKKRIREDPKSLVRVYDKLYPHGRRFFSATELPDLVHLFPFADIWNKYRPMSEAVACLINHIIFCKTQAHRCLIRSIATVLTQHENESASLISLIMDIIIVHLMGNYTGATHRPCLRSRALLRAQFMEMATRPNDEIIEWIDQNQHMVYICFREFMYDQMARTGALRGLMLQTSWQIENEMYCKYACDMTRVMLSDRIRFMPSALDNHLINHLDDMYRAKDIVTRMSHASGEEEEAIYGKRWSVQSPETRDMMIPHLMRGYRKRLHQMKIQEDQADGVVLSMCNRDVFALIDAMNEEMLTKCREFQTKLGKGHFWECMQKDLGKFISDQCPHVLDLGVTEALRDIESNKGDFVTKKDPTGEKGAENAKKKVVQSMITEISSYKSDMFSTLESDGILNGNHIRAIKLVAKYAARRSRGNSMDFSWLIILGVSYGTIAYLNFLYYAYMYHGLPDNRIKNDMIFLLNRQHKKIRAVSPEDLKTESKYKQRKYKEEKYRIHGCYDIGVPFEPWMDECAVRWETVDDLSTNGTKAGPIKADEIFFNISSHDDEGRPFVVSPEEMRDAKDKETLYQRLKETLCHVDGQMGFYADDEEEYRDEDIMIDIATRTSRVHQVLGRDATVNERDIAIICMFLHFYRHATYMQTVNLSREVKQQQIKALKARMGLREIDMAPSDLGVMRYCGCGKWTETIVSSPEHIETIHAKGEYGAAFDLISNIKRCQDAKTRFCGRRLSQIDMIGKAVRMGKSWYVVCVICGIITLWRRESHCDLGPTCGCHACPMRPATKYPMSLLALSSREDIDLHRNLLNQGQLMNGYIHCAYCREYIIPGKAVAVQVWTDDDGRAVSARNVVRSTTGGVGEKEEEEEEERSSMEEWEAREAIYTERFDRAYWEEGYCDPLDTGLQKTAKARRYRRGTIYLCKDHMKHIGWKIGRDRVPTKNNLRRDILRICQQKMNRRRSARFIKGK